MSLERVKKLNIPVSPGCYQFLNKKGGIIYVGKAANLKSRVLSGWREGATHSPAKNSMLKQVAKVKWIETESEIEALLLEANLIKKYQPPYNVLLRDDKRFVYLKVSLSDEIPGVFITRKIDKSGRYFGPFVSTVAVRETLKAIRKIWPYCTMRKRKSKPCFYYQINLCTGICAGVISRKEYLDKVIRPIILFLEGKKGGLIKNYELRIKNLEKEWRERQMSDAKLRERELLKFRLRNIKRVLENAKVIGVAEKYASDVVELAKVLGLKKVPLRIEGYDISNIFGQSAVGSMVVFSDGEPDKSEYRKFKIKIGDGQANDARMLKEVLERRFLHISPPTPLLIRRGEKGERWPLPDLIIVDGGKAQLNAVWSILKKYQLNIPIVAISKGEGRRSSLAPDKLFFPGEKKPLELPLASPALHLIKRVRDEAHRFAISYHRKLKRKRLLE